ncbi:MAG: hypothetical protein IKX00_03600 [Bacilli bacterium]|nr:hypothetical protein [Bacilli bacterium]
MSKVKINYLTYAVVILFMFSGFKNNLLYIFLVFLIHELGHIFFCKLFKINVLCIEIYPFGGIIKLNTYINSSCIKKLFISSGGLIFQLILFLINKLIFQNKIIDSYNFQVFIYNILPIIPLDGSKILQNIMFCFFSYYFSLVAAHIISIISIIIATFYLKNFMFLVFSITFIIKDFINLTYYFNKFLLERYLYGFKFKNYHYYKSNNLKKLQIGKLGYFYENGWKNEKYFLRKRFDKKA